MKNYYKLITLIALLFNDFAFSSVLTVKSDGSADYTTLTAALAAASSGDTLSITGTITGDGVSGEGIVVNKNIKIIGQGADNTTIEAASTQNTANKRVFTIYAGRTVSIQKLSIRHGKTATSGYPAQWGGGIMNYGILTVDDCILTNNNASSSGGAIYNDKYNQVGANGNLTVTNSTIKNNVGTSYGSGICNGYFNTTMVITNCTFFGNTGSAAIGLDRSQNTYITNCTVSWNTSGIWTYASGNNLYLKNTIVAANSSTDFTLLSSASVIESYNIVETSSGYTFTGTGTLTGTQPYLDLSNTLDANASFNPTTTLALYTGSVAIDAGSSASANGIVTIPCKDQRGYLSNGTKDIGAYEFDGATNVPSGIVISSQPISQSACSGGAATFTILANTSSIQWRKNGINILGAYDASLVISSVDSSTIGTYDCLLFETCGVTTSNTATLSFHADTIAPAFNVVNLPNLYSTCSSPVTAPAPTATDDCSGTITATTTDATTYSSLGTHTITWQYEDLTGNTSTQTQQIIISDSAAPVPQLSSLPQINASCSTTLAAPSATDDCMGTIIATTNDPLTYSAEGTFQVTWTYSDGNGNTISQIQEVIINDTTGPIPQLTSLPLVNATCSTTLTAPIAIDNCAGTITATTNDPTSYSIDGNYQVTWNYSDGNGNTTTQIQLVSFDDNTNPVPDITNLAQVNSTCNVQLSAPLATDNCAGQITATTTDPTSYSSQGTYSITWTYDDGNSNTVNQIQTVVIDDNIAPVPNHSTLPDVIGTCYVTLNPPTATDNCAGTITAATNSPLYYSSPGNYMVIWDYTDGNGNAVTQSQSVIVNSIDTTVTAIGNTLQATTIATSYQWLNCDENFSPISGETTANFTPVQTGSYALRIGINNCIDTSACHFISVIQTDITEYADQNSIEIYPNPTSGFINIRTKNEERIQAYSIMNNLGKIITASNNSETVKNSVNLNACSPGIYYIRLVTDRSVITKRIMIKK